MRRASRRGASALELALTLPVFLAFVFGVMDLAWYLYQQSTLESALLAGCRAGALVDAGSAVGEVDRVTRERLLQARATCEAGCAVEVVALGEAPVQLIACTATEELRPLVGLAVRPATLRATVTARPEVTE